MFEDEIDNNVVLKMTVDTEKRTVYAEAGWREGHSTRSALEPMSPEMVQTARKAARAALDVPVGAMRETPKGRGMTYTSAKQDLLV